MIAEGTRCLRLSSGNYIIDLNGDYVFDGEKMVPVEKKNADGKDTEYD